MSAETSRGAGDTMWAGEHACRGVSNIRKLADGLCGGRRVKIPTLSQKTREGWGTHRTAAFAEAGFPLS
jgi:hypothetical protein